MTDPVIRALGEIAPVTRGHVQWHTAAPGSATVTLTVTRP